MADVNIALPKVLGYEGPYDNDPDDPGLETVFGIDRASNPGWPGWTRVDFLKTQPGFPGTVEHDLQVQHFVSAFYCSLWDSLGLTALVHQDLAECIYNGCINQGQVRDETWVQKCLNAMNRINPGVAQLPDIQEDGKVGPLSTERMNLIESNDVKEILLDLLRGQRSAAYTETAHNRPALRKYLTGWILRLRAGG
jgi:lysozyme family protein